jgi:N-acetylglucosamine kinase-like BadF-type ATPase
VGYPGLISALHIAVNQACSAAGIEVQAIWGAGFGVSGFDWPSERAATLAAIGELGLGCPVEAVNDSVLGLLAGSPRGWGVTLVSGTGCNCWGWDESHRRTGQMTGFGLRFGEAAGASELVAHAVQAVAQSWTRRGPATALAEAFIQRAGARDLQDLLEGLSDHTYHIDASAAPLVFAVAQAGDAVANAVIAWAGDELGEMVKAVVRQLGFEQVNFDLVLVGSMFRAGPLLIDPLARSVHALAPGACFMPLQAPPVLGAAVLGMQQAGVPITEAVRARLAGSIADLSVK